MSRLSWRGYLAPEEIPGDGSLEEERYRVFAEQYPEA